jgi:hypothetical protein
MSTFALLLVSLVMGWLATLALVRDVHRLQLRDVLIAASGACCWAFVGMPRMGLQVWGEYGLRFSAILELALAAVTVLVVANLVRGRGFRCGTLCMRSRALHAVGGSTLSIKN